MLVVEGSIPNEAIKSEGYWCGFGNNPETGQPMTTSEWLDRSPPRRWSCSRSAPAPPTAASTPCPATRPGAMGVADYLGWGWKSKAGIPIVNVPGCPVHPDNLSETILYLLYQATGAAPMIPLDEARRPQWLFGDTVHEGCDRGGYYEQGEFATEYGQPTCLVKLGCWGPVVKCNVPEARLDQRRRRLPERRRDLHRLHDAGLPGQVHAVHGRPSGQQGLRRGQRCVRRGDPQAAPDHDEERRHRAQVAFQGLVN